MLEHALMPSWKFPNKSQEELPLCCQHQDQVHINFYVFCVYIGSGMQLYLRCR